MPKPDWNESPWILGHLLSHKICSVDLLFATDSSSSSSSWYIWWVCLRADYSGFNAAYWRSLLWHRGDGAELEYVSNMLWILSKSWLRLKSVVRAYVWLFCRRGRIYGVQNLRNALKILTCRLITSFTSLQCSTGTLIFLYDILAAEPKRRNTVDLFDFRLQKLIWLKITRIH